jgi:hypothetical protein
MVCWWCGGAERAAAGGCAVLWCAGGVAGLREQLQVGVTECGVVGQVQLCYSVLWCAWDIVGLKSSYGSWVGCVAPGRWPGRALSQFISLLPVYCTRGGRLPCRPAALFSCPIPLAARLPNRHQNRAPLAAVAMSVVHMVTPPSLSLPSAHRPPCVNRKCYPGRSGTAAATWRNATGGTTASHLTSRQLELCPRWS